MAAQLLLYLISAGSVNVRTSFFSCILTLGPPWPCVLVLANKTLGCMTDDLLMRLVAHASYPCVHSDFSMHNQTTKASHFRAAKNKSSSFFKIMSKRLPSKSVVRQTFFFFFF